MPYFAWDPSLRLRLGVPPGFLVYYATVFLLVCMDVFLYIHCQILDDIALAPSHLTRTDCTRGEKE